jgi:hypothetical protein
MLVPIVDVPVPAEPPLEGLHEVGPSHPRSGDRITVCWLVRRSLPDCTAVPAV